LIKALETPAHGEALREEAAAAIKSQGWSDTMLSHMPLMGSFIREVLTAHCSESRAKVMSEKCTFSDGFSLPRGTVFAFPAASCAPNSDLVVNPGEFDPYRFVKTSQAKPGTRGVR
jgi:hypothetical protein